MKTPGRGRERALTARARHARRAATPDGPKSQTRSIGARVAIVVFDLIDDAAQFAGVARSKIVEEGAAQRAREIVAHHIALVEKAKRRARAARQAARKAMRI